ncbi:hypothetical protein [Bacteroides acidifaciens]|uniref:hypothetical protein n=1 Tax=Bacteroides acidifaciens TaxID=85831 RepID=UPI0026E9F2AF|nr:hypothetical protein [Bacteroides acidifaciens]
MKIAEEYNRNSELVKNDISIDHMTMVINDVFTRMCIIKRGLYRVVVVDHKRITFTMSWSFRYDKISPLIYNITRRTGDNIFEEMIGNAVMCATMGNGKMYDLTYAMPLKPEYTKSRINTIVTADENGDNIIEVILKTLDSFYGDDYVRLQHITK